MLRTINAGMYVSLVHAPTLSEFERIKSSTALLQLSANARAKLNTVSASLQYLAACAVYGESMYGRSNSQAVDFQNFHIMDARCLDLVN